MKIKLIFLFFLFIFHLFTVNRLLYAGTLDSSAAPTPTMKTLTDIMNCISSGTPAPSHPLQPAVSTGTTTGYTLQQIYDALPSGSTTTTQPADVLSGRTFIIRTTGQLILSTGTRSASSYCVPDTGQTSSYTGTFGEDHDYQPSNTQMSYTDNADGTVTDNRTGLMWVKDGAGAGCNNGATLTWENALSFCENLTFAGYTDWRLPNAKELQSILKFEGSAPFITNPPFINTVSGYYWTSTTYVPDTTYAMIVGFNLGNVTYATKTNTYYVRPVRGGP